MLGYQLPGQIYRTGNVVFQKYDTSLFNAKIFFYLSSEMMDL
jgi:hypothetical protein